MLYCIAPLNSCIDIKSQGNLDGNIDEGFNMTQLTNKSHAQPTHHLVIGSD